MKRLSILLLLGFSFSFAFADQTPNGFISGTAGAGISNARGGDARWVNPALLAMPDNPDQSIILPSFGYRFGNDALRSGQMSDWFRKDRYWTQDERNTLIGSLSGDFTMLGQATAGLGYQYQSFLFAVDGIGAMDAGVPKSLVNMMVNGNQPGARYDLSGIRGGGWAGLSFGFSAAKQFKDVTFAQQFSAGFTARYIVGLMYAGIRTSQGEILTNIHPDTVSLQGNLVSATASNGDGVSFDLGVAARQDENWGWSFSLMNLAGEVIWSGAKVHSNSFGVRASGIPVDSLTKDGFLERWTNYKSSPGGEEGNVANRLPPVMLAGADYRYNPEWLLLGSLEQGLSKGNTMIGGSTRTKWAFGTEYGHFAMVPLRAGISLGGETRFEMQLGAGVRVANYQADIGAGFEHGLFYGAKGFSVALSQRVIL